MAKIKRLASKGYRDAYLASRVRATVAMQVRVLRRSLGKSQKDFARLIGTTQSAVSDLENPDGEQVAVQTLLNIAMALNVALIVKFAGYPDFLKLMGDMSPDGLAADTIDKTLARSAITVAASAASIAADGIYVRTADGPSIPVSAGEPRWSMTKALSSTSSEPGGYVQPSSENSMQIFAKVASAPSTLV